MSLFRHHNQPKNDPRTLPEALWTPKWPCDPPWGLPGRLFGPQSRPRAPQRHPKGSPRPTKVARWRQNCRLQWPFRPQSRPKSFLKHPKAPIVCQNLKFPPPNHQFSFKINDFQQPIVHRRPTDSLAVAFLPFGLCFCIAFVKTTIPVHVP